MARTTTKWVVAALLYGLVCSAGCARNYGDSDGRGPGEDGPGFGRDGGMDGGGQPRVPYLEKHEGLEALHLDYAREPKVFDVGEDRWVIAGYSEFYLWDSAANRIDGVLDTPGAWDAELIWNPGNGRALAVLLTEPYIIDYDAVEFLPLRLANRGEGVVSAGEFGFVSAGPGPNGLVLSETVITDGGVETVAIDEVTDSRFRSLRVFNELYIYRDTQWDLLVQRMDGDESPLVKISDATTQFLFGDGDYLYIDSGFGPDQRRYVYETSTGRYVQFPTGWRWRTERTGNYWIVLERGDERALWRPGRELIEAPSPGFDWSYTDNANTDDVALLGRRGSQSESVVVFKLETGENWKVDTTGLPLENPVMRLDDEGMPIVVWSAFGAVRAYYWRPGMEGPTAIDGGTEFLASIASTRDPMRFVATSLDNRFHIIDLARERIIEAGRASRCGLSGVSSDGRRIIVRVDDVVSIFDAETLHSKVIARNPVFFGNRCSDSFNRNLTRGLFVNAFDGRVGDLVFWDGTDVFPVARGIPEPLATLDALSGTWSLIATTDESVLLASFEEESRTFTVIGEATGYDLDVAYDRVGTDFAFLESDLTGEVAQADVYHYRADTADTQLLASGAFEKVWLLGDDILTVHDGQEPSLSIMVTDGSIDPGPLEERLWSPGSDQPINNWVQDR